MSEETCSYYRDMCIPDFVADTFSDWAVDAGVSPDEVIEAALQLGYAAMGRIRPRVRSRELRRVVMANRKERARDLR